MVEFIGFRKMARLSRDAVISEKIDGTSGQIFIDEDMNLMAGSRTRWITPEKDNFGFARWCEEHKIELINGLGPGRHFGEWWGRGIQRNYGLKEKRFSLFNVSLERKPECCSFVPVLYRGPFDTEVVEEVLAKLAQTGSMAEPGFMRPEGVVVYHIAGNISFKKTLEYDSTGKGTPEVWIERNDQG